MTKITTVARGRVERRTKNRSFQMNYDVFPQMACHRDDTWQHH